MPNVANSPISWHQFQSLMREFGFEMIAHDSAHTGVIFEASAKGKLSGHLKSPVTIAYPTYVTKDGSTPAFERDYVVDLLSQIVGNGTDDALLTLIAKRRLDS